MLWSRSLIPTTREVPADAEIISHQLLIRAGLIRRISAGIYDWLPLGWKSLSKANNIIREEMNAIGALEVHLPALLPAEWWRQTGRYNDYGPLLFKLKDRRSGEMILGPTHEECVTELMRACVTSHRQLPITLYQIQTKFRDEARPRNGLLRVREFFMKDAYSFHTSLESLSQTYQDMFQAYVTIFRRCGVPAVPVEAESGPIGGDASHEFICPCDAGEDIIVQAEDGSYSANLERATHGQPHAQRFADAPSVPSAPLTDVETPEATSIESVCELLKIVPQKMIKTMVYTRLDSAEPRFVVACVRGDHEVNENKLRRLAGPVELADEKLAREHGFAIGYVGPHIANTVPVTLVIDADALMVTDATTGANRPYWHVTNFSFASHIDAAKAGQPLVGDIRLAAAGDRSPTGSPLKFSKGIELGHVFKLGTKYTDALGAVFADEKQVNHSMIMGCYGIGPGRILVGAIETSHDADGIIWPINIAPYEVVITPVKYEGQAATVADDLYRRLCQAGIDVILDDRDQRPGVKFKDADLIGIPLRIVVGDKGLANGQLEMKLRTEKTPTLISVASALDTIVERVKKLRSHAAG